MADADPGQFGGPTDPGVDDLLASELAAVDGANMRLANAVSQDDHFESWEDTLTAVGYLEDAVAKLRDRVHAEFYAREERMDERIDTADARRKQASS